MSGPSLQLPAGPLTTQLLPLKMESQQDTMRSLIASHSLTLLEVFITIEAVDEASRLVCVKCNRKIRLVLNGPAGAFVSIFRQVFKQYYCVGHK